MYDREDALRLIISIVMTIAMLSFMPLALNFLTTTLTSTQEDPEVVINEETELSTIVQEKIESTSETAEEDTTINSIFEETTASAELTESMKNLILTMSRFLTIPLALMLILAVLKFTMGTISYGSFDFSDTSYDSFRSCLDAKKELMLNHKMISQAILQSEKKIDTLNVAFFNKCIEKKTEWYSFKKDIVEVDKNEKLYSVLFLDVLSNLDKIEEFFNKGEENKCSDIKDEFNCSFDQYLHNENNYFKIGNNYYLKEIVFYVITNNRLDVKDFYKYISSSTRRANIACIIANFIESELSLDDDMSVSNTLEEAVSVFNKTYDLDLNLNMAKNLIYLSKINNDMNLQKELLKTNILSDMKFYKHYIYA